MKISQLLKDKPVTLSLEVFPPKTSEKYEATAANAKKIAALHPDFMSVTYGAGAARETLRRRLRRRFRTATAFRPLRT